jgi:hypothetical protein
VLLKKLEQTDWRRFVRTVAGKSANSEEAQTKKTRHPSVSEII